MIINPIAHIHTDFPTKFGIPRQSSLVNELEATIVFEPEYRVKEAFRGLETCSHIWLIWEFTQAKTKGFNPTVRPPRLGGNQRLGVFATRSPFRPNPLGLSCVQLKEIEYNKNLGPVLHVLGADLMDNTPIYDIKPYLPYADSHPEAQSLFSSLEDPILKVEISDQLKSLVNPSLLPSLIAVLSHDPRPRFHEDLKKEYSMLFNNMDVSFVVEKDTLKVTYIKLV